MKLRINYELIQKIDFANKGYSLNNILISNSKFYGLLFIGWCGLDLCVNSYLNNLIENVLITSCFFVSHNLINLITCNLLNEQIKLEATNDLKNLCCDLKKLDIKTDVEALKKAKVEETKYSVIINNKIPCIKQDKYILISVYNKFGNEYVETIHQEHILGSNNYNLSVEKPVKKLVLKHHFV